MNRNNKIEKRIIDALEKQEAKTPRIHELGGDYYFECFWFACGTTVRRWMNYCPECGQRSDWEGVEYLCKKY